MKHRITALKYLCVMILPVLAIISFTSSGILTFGPLLYAFGLIPLLELLFRPSSKNLTASEEAIAKDDWFYDLLVYSVVPIQFVCLYFFLDSMSAGNLTWVDKLGRVVAMGLMCGVIGINVAHELGHRTRPYEQWMSQLLLLSSLYMHFFIEHNRGHHRNVATEDDPASSKRGESLYSFWLRSTWFSYLSAWHLEAERLKKNGSSAFTLKNQMLQFQLIQLGFMGSIFFLFGLSGLLYFIAAATMGFLLLETVNYIEHYGLRREKSQNGRYERVMPFHSWNSDHVVGRLVLFELSRHSDHHFLANRKYQILRHIEDTPQMPTGYPGMMLMSLIPPIWFKVMNKQLDNFKAEAA